MPRVIDQMGFGLDVPETPLRIVSLVPSQTELLAYLGLENRVVGITRFCTAPETWYRNKTRVGGTKDVDLGKIELLKPDLILGNKEENEKETITHLRQSYPVWLSDVQDLASALQMIQALGRLTNTQPKSNALASDIERAFQSLNPRAEGKEVLYFIWRKPWMVAGSNTFIDAMLQRLGFVNLGRRFSGRYPTLEERDLALLRPDFCLLSSEPFPFSERHIEEVQALLGNSFTPELVDGSFFSWYGSRLLQSPLYFEQLMVEMGLKEQNQRH